MIEMMIPMDDFLPEDEELTVKDLWEDVREALPFSFLAAKKTEKGNIYIFHVFYKAYPLYAIVDQERMEVTVTKREPPYDIPSLQEHTTEDDIVFPYIDYRNIISKALTIIVSNKALWVPLLGASVYAKEVVGLPSGIFEEQVNEVVAISKEK